MTLSEAIRLGSMYTEMGRGKNSLTSDTAPCALGAARLAAEIEVPAVEIEVERERQLYIFLQVMKALRERFPIMRQLVRVPSDTGIGYRRVVPMALENAIWIINDAGVWNRQEIADWVEEVEKEIAARIEKGMAEWEAEREALPEATEVAP